MFEEFRQDVKKRAKDMNMTYAHIAEQAGLSEHSIKCFMCGANNSRRVAEKIADVFHASIVYNNGRFVLTKSKDII